MIEKAKEILAGGVKVFLQAKSAKNVEPKREQLPKVLRALRELNGIPPLYVSQLFTVA